MKLTKAQAEALTDTDGSLDVSVHTGIPEQAPFEALVAKGLARCVRSEANVSVYEITPDGHAEHLRRTDRASGRPA